VHDIAAILGHIRSQPYSYRRLWAARTISQAGDVLQFTTPALLIYRLTGSGLGVSGLVLAEIAPVLLLAPLARPLVDRLPRVQVMLAADLLRLAPTAAHIHRDANGVADPSSWGCSRPGV
jgi:hypothetical protein